MDSPQYYKVVVEEDNVKKGFKPYYKWIVLNTEELCSFSMELPCFKPYYKWIVLNT